jgi:antitoxin component YwqK of YwqJK toxin-antitoxin module
MEIHMKNGLPHGHFVRYYESGNKRMEGDARDGKLHGHQTAWYEDGRKKGEGEN